MIHKLSLSKTLHDCMEEHERKAWLKNQDERKKLTGSREPLAFLTLKD